MTSADALTARRAGPWLAAAALGTLICGGATAADPAQSILDALQAASGAPGIGASVSSGGVEIWSGESGHADVEAEKPVTPQTLFRLASVSKLFTAAIALRMAEEGLVDLDSDIALYLDILGDGYPSVSLRQLATHTAGVAHYGGEDSAGAAARFRSPSETVPFIARLPRTGAQGEGYSYSSYGYALIAAALESVSGQSFAALLDHYVAGPHGLGSIIVETPENASAAASRLYAPGGAPIDGGDQRYVLGATGLLGAAGNLTAFADAFAGGRIVNPALVDMSLTPARLNNGAAAEDDRYRIGFGWRLGQSWDGDRVAHHAGTTPGARSILLINRDRNYAVALLANAQWVSRMETTAEMIALAATEGQKQSSEDCPIGAWTYDGSFGATSADPYAAAQGAINVKYLDGLCIAEFEPRGALLDWMRETGARTDKIVAVRAAERDDASIFAAVTHWGAFPMRMTSSIDGLALSAAFPGRELNLRATAAKAAR